MDESYYRIEQMENLFRNAHLHNWTPFLKRRGYVGNERNLQALNAAVYHLQGAAHEWWIGYKETKEGKQVTTSPQAPKSVDWMI